MSLIYSKKLTKHEAFKTLNRYSIFLEELIGEQRISSAKKNMPSILSFSSMLEHVHNLKYLILTIPETHCITFLSHSDNCIPFSTNTSNLTLLFPGGEKFFEEFCPNAEKFEDNFIRLNPSA